MDYAPFLQLCFLLVYVGIDRNVVAFTLALYMIGQIVIRKPLLADNYQKINKHNKIRTTSMMICIGANTIYKVYLILYGLQNVSLLILSQPIAMLLIWICHKYNKPEASLIIISKKYLIPVYLILLSLVSYKTKQFIQYFHIGLFIMECFLFRYQNNKFQTMLVTLTKGICCVQCLIIYMRFEFVYLYYRQDQFLLFILVSNIIAGDFIILNNEYRKILQILRLSNQDIQMQPMHHNEASSELSCPSQRINEQEQDLTLHNMSRSLISPLPIHQEQQKHFQSLNLILIIPFFIFSESFLQIPLYAYMATLIYIEPPILIKYAAYVTVSIMYIYNYQSTNLLQSVCLVLIMNLQVNLEKQLIGFKALWLRWCFVGILAITFWFGLRQVNVYHLILMVILLLFITRGAEKGKRSFRNRNWKYLLMIFNIFTASRYIFIMAVHTFNFTEDQIFLLLGLGFNYNQDSKYIKNFNFLPLIINILLVLQYWTYHSQVYNNQSKKVNQIFKLYVDFLKSVLKIATIVYYKLIIWVSYTIILLIIIIQDYSIGTNLLLIVICIAFISHILEVKWETLYMIWLIFSRLVALQVIARYFFEFHKFAIIYNLVKDYPLYKFINHYQKVLGLSVDYQTIYLHTITKFQLMMGIDMSVMLMGFLVMQYLNILIKKDNNFEDLQPSEIQKYKQLITYIEYQPNSETWIYKILTRFGILKNVYNNTFYFFTTVFATLCFRYFSLCYLLVYLAYYYGVNSYEYKLVAEEKQIKKESQLNLHLLADEEFHQSNLITMIKQRFQRWFETKETKIQTIKTKINQIQMEINKKIYSQHKRYRKFFLVLTFFNIIFTFFSRLFSTQEFDQFINDKQITLRYKWYAYIYGCSLVEKSTVLNILPFIVFLFLAALEWKCNKPLQSERQQYKQDRIIRLFNNKQFQMQTKIKITLLLGVIKIVERSYVMLLVFTSTIKNTPFSILYLFLAFILSSIGNTSLYTLSILLIIIILSQYGLILINYQNQYIYSNVPSQFGYFIADSPFKRIVSDDTWIKYWGFGKNIQQIIIFLIGICLLSSYQLYYSLIVKTSNLILQIIESDFKLTFHRNIYRIIKSVYKYFLVFSPLYIALISISLYLSDYTLTNLLLCSMSVLFLYKEYIGQEISDLKATRSFWKAYYRLLQGFIILFMVMYCVLSIPQYKRFCNNILCSEGQYKTKIVKALLILLFQIGVDLLKSREYQNQMAVFYQKFKSRASILKLAIAFKENDSKIQRRFEIENKKNTLRKKCDELMEFLQRVKINPSLQYSKRYHIPDEQSTLLDLLLAYLPKVIDPLVMMSRTSALQNLEKQNQKYIQYKGIKNIEDKLKLDIIYKEEFEGIANDQLVQRVKLFRLQINQKPQYFNSMPNPRFSMQPQKFTKDILRQQIRKSRISNNILTNQQQHDTEKKNLLYELIVYSLISNWQYLTYFTMIIQHIHHGGLLTLYYPVAVFCVGIVQQYQASTLFWKATYCYTLLVVIFKYLIGLNLIEISKSQLKLILGTQAIENTYQLILFVLILLQVIFLQQIGLYERTLVSVQSIKMALVRNIIKRKEEDQEELQRMLQKIVNKPNNFLQFLFCKSVLKKGHDYSTLITTIQIFSIVYIFLFYDRMFIDTKISFYEMIQYNQFTAGMVIWLLLQVLIMLLDRFIGILNLQSYSAKWEWTLIYKYTLLLLTMGLVHYMMIFHIPTFNANKQNGTNNYCLIFYVIYCFYFLVSSLQIRDGIDQLSRGFMERYVWYNGYVYLCFRAVPFIFEFKVFSDWFVTRTVMRLFDWIKFEDLFGRLFVAKCNSIFLRGKIMGSKIEWWKKLLMGFPLLVCILAFLFGPLVLFSSLNPLASLNQITGGSVELTLKINQRNEYPLYINSHISDIHTPTTAELQQLELADLIETYNIQQESIQILNLEEYSDLYWQISEGSEKKLLQQPNDSLYQLVLTVKFQRKYTSTTPLYTLNSVVLPTSTIESFKSTLRAQSPFKLQHFYDSFIRLDNNNGIHILSKPKSCLVMFAQQGKKNNKKYWIIQNGLSLAIVSDKYSKAIFGYSVVGFYISIILVVANYFRFIFQGGANAIVLSDIPTADPLLTLCESIYLCRQSNLPEDLILEDKLFWTLIDLCRSPDTIKLLTGNYLDARKQTLRKNSESKYSIQSIEEELEQEIVEKKKI